MDKLIDLFGKSITYVKKNNGKNFSSDLANEFHSYLEDITKRAKDLKQLSSKKNQKKKNLE